MVPGSNRLAVAAAIATFALFAAASRRPADPSPVAPHAARPRSADAALTEYFVAPGGKPEGAGTRDAPLDLATALSGNSPARPGDTIWLRGGTYWGPFVSDVRGSADAPVVVKQYPGERAVIDGVRAPAESTLTVRGTDTSFIGFEVTNSSPARDSERGIGVHVLGAHTRLINLVVHDTGNGIGFWSPALDSELYGNVIFNIGWQEHGQGKGHAIYVQNDRGVKRIVDNVLFNGYSFGVHAYTEQGRIDNLHFTGNVSFNNGVLAPDGERKANILVGGWRVASSPTLTDNVTYFNGPGGRGMEIGYHAGCVDARIVNNVLVGGSPIVLRRCQNVVMQGNRFYGPVDDEIIRQFPDNAYAFAEDETSTQVFVRPNAYDKGRATIVVLNWSRRPKVAVDLGAVGLAKGDRFEIRDAQNYLGPPVTRGVYVPSAAVSLPMADESAAAAQPVGAPPPVHTSRAFGVFIVRRG